MMIKKLISFIFFCFVATNIFAETELDYMEYATPGDAQTAYVTSDTIVSSASIDDEDMANITDWADNDDGTAVSSQVTFDGKSSMKLDTGATDGSTALRVQDIGSFGARTVFSINVYCDEVGIRANTDYLAFWIYNGSTGLGVVFASDGLFIWDGSGYNEAGTDLVIQDTWQEWTFDVNWTAQTVDIYLNKVLMALGADCSFSNATAEGTVQIYQFSSTTANRLSYIDWFKAGADAGGLECFSESTIKQQGSYSLKVEAIKTDSLNDTLTRTVNPTKDLSGLDDWVFYIYSNRTGSNIKVGIRDSGGTTTETTPNVTSAGAWQKVTVDISGVSNVNKDAIDRIILTPVNADAANTFYIDNMFAESVARRRILLTRKYLYD